MPFYEPRHAGAKLSVPWEYNLEEFVNALKGSLKYRKWNQSIFKLAQIIFLKQKSVPSPA